VIESPLYVFDTDADVDEYVDSFHSVIQQLLDRHASLISRCRRVGKNDCRWLSDEARAAKRLRRRRERRYRRTQSAADRQHYISAQTAAGEAIHRSRSDHIRQRYQEAVGDAAATWRVTRDILHRRQRTYHSDADSARLAVDFSAYFHDKLSRIRQSIAAGLHVTSQFVFPSRSHSGPKLADIGIVSADEVRKVIHSTAVKSSPLDVLPSTMLRECADVFVPFVAHMANLTFS